VKINADTSVLVRAMIADNDREGLVAQAELAGADSIAVALPVLCELVWVLSRGYNIPADQIAGSIRRLVESANVMVNRPAVEAGLAVLNAGGDFADGIIAHEGRWLGADTFVSFDRTAVMLLSIQGHATRLLQQDVQSL
jgi:predicted nucleic-acid-binding protein